MTKVKLDKDLVKDLIIHKMKKVQEYIETVLKSWNETSTKIFLDKARSGEYENAEDDAVEVHQLLLDYFKYQKILKNI